MHARHLRHREDRLPACEAGDATGGGGVWDRVWLYARTLRSHRIHRVALSGLCSPKAARKAAKVLQSTQGCGLPVATAEPGIIPGTRQSLPRVTHGIADTDDARSH